MVFLSLTTSLLTFLTHQHQATEFHDLPAWRELCSNYQAPAPPKELERQIEESASFLFSLQASRSDFD